VQPGDNNTALIVSTEFADPGDTATVKIRIANNPGFAAMIMRIETHTELTFAGHTLAEDI